MGSPWVSLFNTQRCHPLSHLIVFQLHLHVTAPKSGPIPWSRQHCPSLHHHGWYEPDHDASTCSTNKILPFCLPFPSLKPNPLSQWPSVQPTSCASEANACVSAPRSSSVKHGSAVLQKETKASVRSWVEHGRGSRRRRSWVETGNGCMRGGVEESCCFQLQGLGECEIQHQITSTQGKFDHPEGLLSGFVYFVKERTYIYIYYRMVQIDFN